MIEITTREGAHHRLAGGFVLAVMALACAGFWIGVPLATLYVLGEATDDGAVHFVAGLVGVPVAMVLFSPALFWLNALYLRITGVYDRLAEDEDAAEWHRRVRGPLEPMLIACFVVAAIALSIWFFVFAENAPPHLI